MKIAHTDVDAQHPWPEGTHVQGGSRGVVLRGEGAYRTAFVEAFPPGTFIRGEGPTIADAETACWGKFQAMQACPTYPDHGPYEARNYSNGSGFCTGCGTWFANVLPPSGPDGTRPGRLERALGGDPVAAVDVLTVLDNVDQLPEGPPS